MAAPYVIVLVSGAADQFSATLRAEFTSAIKTAVESLGLDSDQVDILEDPDPADVPRDRPVVAAFFGATSLQTHATDLVDALQKTATFILPVVPDLARYPDFVPTTLAPINGMSPHPGDDTHAAIVSRLFEELRLLRRKRLAFISYKRSDSQAVANQLHDALEQRSFEVFLDTYSVTRGVDFQSVLYDSMGNSDLIVLLDTPNAFNSQWVQDEIARADTLGIGVLQIVWPGNTRTPGLEQAGGVIYLEDGDFVGSNSQLGGSGILTNDCLTRVGVEAEIVRAKSMGARRRRVVDECQREAVAEGFSVSIHRHGHLEVRRPQGARIFLLPVVGHPDSVQLHQFETVIAEEYATGSKVALVFDPLGLLTEKSLHLSWLNQHLPPQTVALRETKQWLDEISRT